MIVSLALPWMRFRNVTTEGSAYLESLFAELALVFSVFVRSTKGISFGRSFFLFV
jgi:hypothetical protein